MPNWHTRIGIPTNRVKLFAIAAALASSLAASEDARADLASGVAAFQQGDHARALAELEPLASGGDPTAQFYVGRIRAEAPGLQDYVQAYKWLSCSIGRGSATGGIGARLLREQIALSLDTTNLREAQRLARDECGVEFGIGLGSLAEREIYFPNRDGMVETVTLFAGDLTIWGLLTIAKAFGIEWLQKMVASLYESYQVWLVAFFSLVWWGLFIRIIVVIARAMGNQPLVELREPTFGDTKDQDKGKQQPRPTRQIMRRLFGDDDISPG